MHAHEEFNDELGPHNNKIKKTVSLWCTLSQKLKSKIVLIWNEDVILNSYVKISKQKNRRNEE
jgi:hypothetical protein